MAQTKDPLPILEYEEQILSAIRNNPVTVVIGATGSGKSTQLPQMLLRAGIAGRKTSSRGAEPRAREQPESSHGNGSTGEPEARRLSSQEQRSTAARPADGSHRPLQAGSSRDERKSRTEGGEADPDAASRKRLGRGEEEATLAREEGAAGDVSPRSTRGRGEHLQADWEAEDQRAIAVTQPRRVAAVAVARRVAEELRVPLGRQVGYSVRFEDRSCAATRVVFQTDGCLLRELLGDPLLRRYGVVVLDEAHERSINTDVLFGLLKRLVLQRPDLKLVVTSATLDGQKFSEFFHGCPVVEVPGRLFPVQLLYSTERAASYLQSAVETAMEIHEGPEDGDILVFLTGQDEIERAIAALQEKIRALPPGQCRDAIILPLHASLPPELQVRVFAPAPANCRRIIVATNVAETAVTLDGIVFVVDPGYVKQRQYDPDTQLAALQVVPISKVQAIQRAGRAGRTRPGKCFRLYPKSVFDHELPEVTEPEIRRSSLAGTVLHLKSLRLPGADDVLAFDFLDRPKQAALEDALHQLFVIGCIDSEGRITTTGKEAAALPLDPSLAVTLLAAAQHQCLPDAIVVAAMLSADIALPSSDSSARQHARPGSRRGGERVKLPDGEGFGDHIRLLQLFREWEAEGFAPAWCKRRDIQIRSMQFARDVVKQLSAAVSSKMLPGAGAVPRGGGQQAGDPAFSALRRALCVGYGCKLAQRMLRHNGYRTVHAKPRLVEVHPSSAPLAVDADGLLPEWLLFHEVLATSRAFMRGVCAVEGAWVAPVLPRLQLTDLKKLSGGSRADDADPSPSQDAPQQGAVPAGGPPGPAAVNAPSAVDAARERYLARKKQRK